MVFTTYLFVFYFLPLPLVFYYALKGFCRQAGAPNGRTCLVLNTLLVLAATSFTVGGTLLLNKRLVIWEFAERDIRFGTEGWQIVPLARSKTTPR